MKTITDFPTMLLDLFESYRLVSQNLRDVEEIATPFDLAVASHLADHTARVVLHRWHFTRVNPSRRTVKSSGSLSSECLMGTLGIIELLKQIEMTLLSLAGRLRRNVVLERSVHAFVTAILARLARLDPLGMDTELNPPLRQLTDSAESQGGKRSTVVSTNGERQAILPKRPLQPGSDRPVIGTFQGPTHQQVAREVVRERQGIAAVMVPQGKVSFEVGTPDLIGCLARTKRFCVRRDMAAFDAPFDQARLLKNFTRCRVSRPFKLRTLLTQVVQHLLGSPTLVVKFGCNNHLADFFIGPI